MKTLSFFLIALMAITFSACDCHQLPCLKADLIVEDFAVIGPAKKVGNNVELPVRVRVKNQGIAPAGIFKVSVHYTNSAGNEFVVAFTVPGQSSPWYPFTSAALPPNGDILFVGKLVSPYWRDGERLRLRAIADSCSGDELMPEYCRVEECDETNNSSDFIGATIVLN